MTNIPQNRCIDCGKKVSAPHVLRCRACYHKAAHAVALTKHPVVHASGEPCPKCGKPMMNTYATQCVDCYRADLFGENNPNWNPDRKCIRCGQRVSRPHVRLCQKCYNDSRTGLPRCKKCGKPLSRYDSDKVGTGYCQSCYRGEVTRRWNPELTEDERWGRRHNVPGYGNWRRAVFERDGYTCQCCGDARGGNLVAHHIYSYRSHPEYRTDVNNGIALCEVCHRRFHRLYGGTNNTSSQLELFLLKAVQS